MFKVLGSLVVAALLVTAASAAEPEKLFSGRVGGAAEGRLIRTAQGLALFTETSLTPLEGGRPPSEWSGRKYTTPVPPTGRWLLAVEKSKTGGFAERQLRGMLIMGDLDAAAPFGTPPKILHNAAWPVAGFEDADGVLTMLLWAKGKPWGPDEGGYVLVRWKFQGGPAKTASWPSNGGVLAQGQMAPDGQGGFALLTRLGEGSECGRRAGFSLTRIDAALTVSAGPTVCLSEAFTIFTSEVIASAQTSAGPVWFVSGKEAGAHKLARISAVGGELKVKTLGDLQPGGISSAAFDGEQLLVVQDGRVSRVADGQAIEVPVPDVTCDGRPGVGRRKVSVSTLDGRIHLMAASADGCVNLWRL